MHHTTRGIFWMVAACFMSAVLVSLVHYASRTVHPFELVFFRNIFSLVCFLPWLMRHNRSGGGASMARLLTTGQFRWHLLRAGVGFFGMITWFYGLSVVPLPLATALSFTSPLMTAVASVLLFRERYGWHRWGGLIFGFCGALVILHPGTGHFTLGAGIVLLAAMFWTFSGIIIKKLTQKDTPELVAFYLVLVGAPLSLPLALAVWKTPTWEELGWMFALGWAASMFQVMLSRAIAATDFSVILPFDFLRLVFASVFAYFLFDEIIDAWTLFGAAMILGGAAYTAYRTRRYHREDVPNAEAD